MTISTLKISASTAVRDVWAADAQIYSKSTSARIERMRESEPRARKLLHLIAASSDDFAHQHWRHVNQFFRWDKTFDVVPSAMGVAFS